MGQPASRSPFAVKPNTEDAVAILIAVTHLLDAQSAARIGTAGPVSYRGMASVMTVGAARRLVFALPRTSSVSAAALSTSVR